MNKGNTVTGWFGSGVITDIPQFDNLIRIRQLDRHGQRKYRWVMRSDAEVDSGS
jgi:hypothetical protein